MTVLVAFDRLLVEGRFTEGGGHEVVVPGAVTQASMPCPVTLKSSPDAPATEVGWVTMLHRQACEYLIHEGPHGRYGMVTWVWAALTQIQGRSVDEVDCLIRDYRPQVLLSGTYDQRGEQKMMLEGQIIGVTLVRNLTGRDPGWRIIDRATADAWMTGTGPFPGGPL